MPGQSPAGRSGAAAPRDQPAPPPNGDGAPPPAKQGSAGAEGAEIARPTDSASEGPRPSDSLAAQLSTMDATASMRATTVDNSGQRHHMALRSQVSVGGGRSSDNHNTSPAVAAAALHSSTERRAPPTPATASPSAAERLPAAPVSPRPASAPPSPAPPASCAGDADPNPVPSGFEPLTQNAYHQLEQVGNYLLKTLAQGPDAAPPSRAAVTPLPAASSTSTAAAAHLPTRFVGGCRRRSRAASGRTN